MEERWAREEVESRKKMMRLIEHTIEEEEDSNRTCNVQAW